MARTKQTGPPKAKAAPKKLSLASTPNAIQAPPTPIKSPAQPTELSEEDRKNVKAWLDDSKTSFKVDTAPMSRKRKRSGASQPQGDLFEERLDVQYEVKPRDKWECLRRYKKFTVGSESLSTGQCILVKHDENEEAGIDVTAQWKAKVLEVRALDTEHVYIRVAWLNRPEDLKTGRKSYHGKFELIPTNEMDIIDAMSVNGPCNVVHWDETDDDAPPMPEDQFFWRQTYDSVGTKTFSDLRKMCVDEAPVNPDEIILQCSNKACRQWLHVKCIVERAVQEAAAEVEATIKKPARKKSKGKKNSLSSVVLSKSSLAQARAENDTGFISEVMIKDMPDIAGQPKAESSEILITNVLGETTSMPMACLFCGEAID